MTDELIIKPPPSKEQLFMAKYTLVCLAGGFFVGFSLSGNLAQGRIEDIEALAKERLISLRIIDDRSRELAEAVDRLEREVEAFGFSSWREVVPAVQRATEETAHAAQRLQRAVESGLDN